LIGRSGCGLRIDEYEAQEILLKASGLKS
jgi:hypothetical protein